MTTQEKLVMELVDEICDWDEYCGDENCNKCGGAIKHWKKKLTHLIESAKREGGLEELMKLKSERHESREAWCNASFFIDSEDIWERITELKAELKQSEESI